MQCIKIVSLEFSNNIKICQNIGDHNKLKCKKCNCMFSDSGRVKLRINEMQKMKIIIKTNVLENTLNQ